MGDHRRHPECGEEHQEFLSVTGLLKERRPSRGAKMPWSPASCAAADQRQYLVCCTGGLGAATTTPGEHIGEYRLIGLQRKAGGALTEYF